MQKYANLVELEKCCQTHIFLQNFVLIQPRTSPPKICIFSKNAFSKNAFSKNAFFNLGASEGGRFAARLPTKAPESSVKHFTTSMTSSQVASPQKEADTRMTGVQNLDFPEGSKIHSVKHMERSCYS